jgi:hypothetical protein
MTETLEILFALDISDKARKKGHRRFGRGCGVFWGLSSFLLWGLSSFLQCAIEDVTGQGTGASTEELDCLDWRSFSELGGLCRRCRGNF